jgi:hypothetical protein
MPVNFEYCECGCHCHEADVGGIYFKLYNDLKGNFYLSTKVSGKTNQVRYDTWDDAVEAATKTIRETAKKMLADIGEPVP